MPHTNNPEAKARKASRAGKKPKFLLKKTTAAGKRPSKGTIAEATASTTTAEPGALGNDEPREVKAQLIRDFHTIEKRLAATQDPVEHAELIARRDQLGGLSSYQEASIHGGDKNRGGESSKWCVKQLKELKVGVNDKGKAKQVAEPTIGPDGKKVWPKIEREKLRLLDVGAIAGTAYSAYPWIDATSIDLNPQADHVLKCDFFDFEHEGPLFDVVALSLVLNFEGSLTRRAEMLRRAHQFLKPQGLMYLVLPLPCITNSRYMNHARLESILLATGWKQVRQHDSAKLTYWLCKRVGDGRGDETTWKREQVRGGIQRNNFCIVVNGLGEKDEADEGQSSHGGVEEIAEKEAAEDAQSDDEWAGIEDKENQSGADDDEAEWGGIEG